MRDIRFRAVVAVPEGLDRRGARLEKAYFTAEELGEEDVFSCIRNELVELLSIDRGTQILIANGLHFNELFENDICEVLLDRSIDGKRQSNHDIPLLFRGVVKYSVYLGWYLNFDNNYNKSINKKRSGEQYDRNFQTVYAQGDIGLLRGEVIGDIHSSPDLLEERNEP